MTLRDEEPGDEELWRSRFITINLVRIGGTLVVLLGLLVWHSDLIAAGGSIAIGLPMALLGLTISFAGPKRLAARWKAPPPR